MYEFLDRLINVAIARIRDFHGISPDSFDGRGNYTLGIKEQLIFPEIEFDSVNTTLGMNITIATNSKNDEEAKELLRLIGMPFKKDE
jgi:large subunit ribosomal protein L5